MTPAKQLLQSNCLPRAHFRRVGSNDIPKKQAPGHFCFSLLSCSLQMKMAAPTDAVNLTEEVPHKDVI